MISLSDDVRAQPASDMHASDRRSAVRSLFVNKFSMWTIAALLIALVGAIAYTTVVRSSVEDLKGIAEHRLDVIAASLDGELARFDYLPPLLEVNSNIARLFDPAPAAGVQSEVNHYLHSINATAGSTTVYVLNLDGVCLAASDWDQPGTPLGMDLSFRPYMRDALSLGRGRFYGVGITSGLAGYYMSYALHRNGKPIGVVVVKIVLEKAEREWAKLPGDVLVLDERGVAILSSQAGWKYRPLRALDESELRDIGKTRPYGSAALVPLDWKTEIRASPDMSFVRLSGLQYYVASRELPLPGWHLLLLQNTAAAKAGGRNAGIASSLAALALLLGALALLQRQRLLRHRLANQVLLQAANDALESRVIERTCELVNSNTQLARTQRELVHAGKMAILGQLAAGLVHEINQPLTALRTLSDNACVLIEHGRTDEASANLWRIAQVTERLGMVVGQLKTFAHKSTQLPSPVLMRRAVSGALLLLADRLRKSGVEMQTEIAPEGLTVLADQTRLEQVLVNLIGNGIDAVAKEVERRVSVHATQQADGRCIIVIKDSGPGICDEVLVRLFEPFMTTKPAGMGLGLGLVISAHIVRELGGTLNASNEITGGARFVFDLPVPNPNGQESPGR
jgi:two-component system C4-dicarboxylate transport sensor histidine kinase DctB